METTLSRVDLANPTEGCLRLLGTGAQRRNFGPYLSDRQCTVSEDYCTP